MNVEYIDRRNWLQDVFTRLIPLAIILLLWRFFFRRAAGGSGTASSFNFSKSTATLTEKENRNITTFDDVAGLDEAT